MIPFVSFGLPIRKLLSFVLYSHDDIERETLKGYAEVVRSNLAFRATPLRRERGAGHANLDQWDFRYSTVGDGLQKEP